jgi:hypothetical protein
VSPGLGRKGCLLIHPWEAVGPDRRPAVAYVLCAKQNIHLDERPSANPYRTQTAPGSRQSKESHSPSSPCTSASTSRRGNLQKQEHL